MIYITELSQAMRDGVEGMQFLGEVRFVEGYHASERKCRELDERDFKNFYCVL